MIEAIEVLEGKINESNVLDGELNKNVEYVEPTTQTKTVTPTKQEQIIEPDEGIFALSKVTVNPIGDEYVIPSGTLNISANGNYDVKEKEYANVTFNEWAKYGFTPEPTYIKKIKDDCDEIQENYDTSITSWSYRYSLASHGKNIIIFPSLNTENVTDFSYAIYGQTQLKNIALLNTSNATNFSNMFYGCTTLQTIPQFDLSKATTCQNMFYNCYAITDIPELNISSCTNCQGMFYGCSSNLETAPILTLSTQPNLTLASMFNGCSSLKNVPIYDISHISYSNKFTNMFKNCNMLTDTSLNNILYMCSKNTIYGGTKTLAHLGFTSTNYPVSRIQALSNYSAFTQAGWSIGY